MSNFVTIFFDQLTDLFAIVDSKQNKLLYFGLASESKYAEIFAYKSFGTAELEEICTLPNTNELFQIPSKKDPESKSKQLAIHEEKYILSYDEAIGILNSKYGSNFVVVNNGEFKIQDWQAAKKIKHAASFGINLESYGFSQQQTNEIDKKRGIISYVRKGSRLPSLDLIRDFQTAIKDFCEDQDQVEVNYESTFRGQPSITFLNRKTGQIVVFKRATKTFLTGYKLSETNVDKYLETGKLGQET